MSSRDSAGVRIVESVAAAWGSAPHWSVGSSPEVSVGATDTEEDQLHRVGGAAVLSDGGIAIGNGGTSQVRLYDRSGALRQIVGQQGEGPGDFSRYTSIPLWTTSGGRIVADAGANRLNVFESTGRLLQTVHLQSQPVAPLAYPVGLLADGSVLATALPSSLQGAPGAVLETRAIFLRFDSAGQFKNVIVDAPGRPRYVHQYGEGTQARAIPLTPEPLIAAMPTGGVALIRGAEPTVEFRSADGALVSMARWFPTRRRVGELWERMRAAELARAGESPQRAAYEDFYRQPLPLPEWVPVATRLVSDSEGHLWIERFRLPWEAAAVWDILAPDGEWLGAIELPPGGVVYQIGRDFILGRWSREDGAPVVRKYRLDRQRPAP